jgi:hypothetical protein
MKFRRQSLQLSSKTGAFQMDAGKFRFFSSVEAAGDFPVSDKGSKMRKKAFYIGGFDADPQ